MRALVVPDKAEASSTPPEHLRRSRNCWAPRDSHRASWAEHVIARVLNECARFPRFTPGQARRALESVPATATRCSAERAPDTSQRRRTCSRCAGQVAMTARALLAAWLAAPLAPLRVRGPIFDAHLHYNDDAIDRYPVGTVMELFSKNGVKRYCNSRPNDGTRALYEANRKARETGSPCSFIRSTRPRDYGTWHANPDIAR